jgi:hypothetical protein
MQLSSEMKRRSIISEAEANAEAYVRSSQIKDQVVIDQTETFIEVARRKTQAEKEGIKLTWERLDDYVKYGQQGITLNLNNLQENSAVAKAMNNSEDRSMQAGDRSIINTGSLDNRGGKLNLGEMSRTVTNAINQLPDPAQRGEADVKTLLMQLQQLIEKEEQLQPERKVKALRQVEALAEAGKNPEEDKEKAENAIDILKGITSGLPTATQLVEGLTKLLPAITALFGLII